MPDQLTSCSPILASVRDHICATLSFANYHGVPIPTIRRGRLCAAVLIGRGEFVSPPGGYQIWDPHLLAVFSAVDGSLEELRGIAEMPNESQKPIGRGVSPLDLLEAPALEARAKYCELADTVMIVASKRADYKRYQDELFSRFVKSVGEVLSPYWSQVFMKEISP